MSIKTEQTSKTAPSREHTIWWRVGQDFLASRPASVALGVLALIVLAALLAPWIAI